VNRIRMSIVRGLRGLGLLAMIAVIAAMAVISCRRDPGRTETHEQTRPPADQPAPAQDTKAKVLDIAPEMLRDLRITTIRIASRSSAEAASLLGELRVDDRRYAEVASPVAARTRQLLASPGDRVKSGQGLVELDSVELGKARAEYQSAAARLTLAQRTLARKRELADEHIAPLREVQEAEAQVSAGEADVRSAQAALAAFGVGREDATVSAGGSGSSSGTGGSQFVLRSPIAGVVIERTATMGQMVDATKTLFRIADLSRLWLVVHAFERDAVRLAEGAPARITLPALPGRTVQGRVAFIGREVDATSRTIPVRIELNNPDGLLRPGMSASASLPVGASDSTLMVPSAALQRVNEHWCVFIPRSASAFEVRPIGRGRDFGGDVEVLSGLRDGELVVVEGAFLLRAEAGKSASAGEEH
jgi:cobalt-zinc-cadmium efflux system membrane fusion protein